MGLTLDPLPSEFYAWSGPPLPPLEKNPSVENNSSETQEEAFVSQQSARRGPTKRQITGALQSHIHQIARGCPQDAYLTELANEQTKHLEAVKKEEAHMRAFKKDFPSSPAAAKHYLAQVDEGICALQGAFPGFATVCSSERRIENAAMLSFGVRKVNQGINWVVEGAASGVAEGAKEICAVHPIMQQKCHRVARTSSQVVKAIEDFWEDSPAQQAAHYLAEGVSGQYHKGISLFSEALLDEGYSFETVIQHRRDLETLAGASISLAGFGAVSKLGGKVMQTVRAQKSIAAPAPAPVVSQIERPIIPTDSHSGSFKSHSQLRHQKQVQWLYDGMIANEKELVAHPGFAASPFIPPKDFTFHRNLFLTKCQMHKIFKKGLGRNQLGVVSENLLSHTTDHHMLFLIQRSYMSSILNQRKITPKSFSHDVLSAERLDVMLREAINIAQKEADVRRVSFAWAPSKQAVATTLLKQGHKIIARGSFSIGKLEPPMELVEILFKKTIP